MAQDRRRQVVAQLVRAGPVTATGARSSRCDAGACVLVAYRDGTVQVRNSRDPNHPPLVYGRDEWQALVAALSADPDSHPDLAQSAADWTWAKGGVIQRFTAVEIEAFVDGVRDGEFHVDRLAANAEAVRHG